VRFRRARSGPRSVTGFRAATFAIGLAYILASTDTIQTIKMALEAINKLGESIQIVAGASPKPPSQEK
jgi:hypothetical protein